MTSKLGRNVSYEIRDVLWSEVGIKVTNEEWYSVRDKVREVQHGVCGEAEYEVVNQVVRDKINIIINRLTSRHV